MGAGTASRVPHSCASSCNSLPNSCCRQLLPRSPSVRTAARTAPLKPAATSEGCVRASLTHRHILFTASVCHAVVANDSEQRSDGGAVNAGAAGQGADSDWRARALVAVGSALGSRCDRSNHAAQETERDYPSQDNTPGTQVGNVAKFSGLRGHRTSVDHQILNEKSRLNTFTA